MRIAIVDYNRSIPNGNLSHEVGFKRKLWNATEKGLAKLGHNVEYLAINAWEDRSVLPSDADLYIFWNGQKKARKLCRESVEAHGKKTICAEHAWLGRYKYFHFSTSGHFGPFSHFAKNMGDEPTEEMIQRAFRIIRKFKGTPEGEYVIPRQAYVPVKHEIEIPNTVVALKLFIGNYETNAREIIKGKNKAELREIAISLMNDSKPEPPQRDGNILIVQQVNGDAQHGDNGYEVVRWTNNVLQSIGIAGTSRKVVIRSHPNGPQYNIADYNIDNIRGVVELQNSKVVDINDALKEAAYVITFNSNTVNLALLENIPVITDGPNLADHANGITLPGESHDLYIRIEQAENGWTPDVDAIERYFGMLCSYQWNVGEIADGEVLKPLLVNNGETK